MVVSVMAEIPGLQYYLFVLIALLLGSIYYNLKQKNTELSCEIVQYLKCFYTNLLKLMNFSET